MIFPRSIQESPLDAEGLELDVEVAMGVDGFRWVRWMEGESPDPPRESMGRFLARHDDPLAHVQLPAAAAIPLAPQPYRHLPRYSLDAGAALQACDQVGLFRDGGATLGQDRDGTWTLGLTGEAPPLRDPRLPRLLTRGVLRWLRLRRGFGKSLP